MAVRLSRARALAGLGILALALAACQRQEQQPQLRAAAGAGDGGGGRRARHAAVHRRGGQVRGERGRLRIQPQISGRIVKIHFADGADLKQGDLLFMIDPRPVQATVQQAEANVARDQAQARQAEANTARDQAAVAQAQAALTQARAQLAQAEANVVRDQAQLENARVQDQRYSELVRQGYVAREQSDQVRTAMETAAATVRADQAMVENGKAAVAAAEAGLAQAKAAVVAGQAAVENARATVRANEAMVDSARLQLAYTEIRSPIDGRAGQRLVDLGNVVTANTGSLLSIQRIDPIYAEFTVTENELTEVQRNMQEGRLAVEVRLPDQPSTVIPGTLTFLDNAVHEGTGTVKLRATVAEPRAPALARALRERPADPRADRRRGAGAGHRAPELREGPLRLRGQGRRDRRPPAGDARAAPGRPGHRLGGRQGQASRSSRTARWASCPAGRSASTAAGEPGEAGRARSRAEAMNLSEPFIRRPVMTAVLTASVVLFGVLSYRQLPVNDLPAVDYPVIQVQVDYPGASPDTMANNIATPLERQFMQINGLEIVTSKSTQGQASLTLQFALEKNIDAAATDVQTAISQATGSLPADLPSPPTLSKTNPNDQPIMYIALTSDSVTPGQLYDYANTQVGQRISILPGVSRVDVFGAKSAIRIKADPSAMWARGISVDDLAAAIRGGTSYTGAGQFDGASRYRAPAARTGSSRRVDAYKNLIVGGTSDGAPVYLRDIAEVRDSVQDERVNMRFWARGYDGAVRHRDPRREPPGGRQRGRRWRRAIRDSAAAWSARELRGRSGSRRSTTARRPSCTPSHDVQATLVVAFVLVVIVIFVFLGRADRHADPGRRAAALAPHHVHRDAAARTTASTTCR